MEKRFLLFYYDFDGTIELVSKASNGKHKEKIYSFLMIERFGSTPKVFETSEN